MFVVISDIQNISQNMINKNDESNGDQRDDKKESITNGIKTEYHIAEVTDINNECGELKLFFPSTISCSCSKCIQKVLVFLSVCLKQIRI